MASLSHRISRAATQSNALRRGKPGPLDRHLAIPVTIPGELSAELRFWWQHSMPNGLHEWFDRLGPARTEERRDHYAWTGSTSWSVKRRGDSGPVECKARLERQFAVGGGIFRAGLWLKQRLGDSPETPLDIAVVKQRRLVAIANRSGDQVCEVELSRIALGRDIWITLCIEAQAHLSNPLANLPLAWAGEGGLPDLCAKGWPASYPEWLMRVAKPARARS